ncbi:hypothetical protein AMEX_G1108 [Astyanax mexicanus]|uniref:Uncharacterized protein n=1 Tax=Astyanax mexicanus TaxID=7994 RepID=A0A8T2MKB9_ASTMX|nr:hypothetical protein AMEX_G1108 [Astyanax mexicanus]
MGGKLSVKKHIRQGHESVGEELMETCGDQLNQTLVDMRNRGLNFKWDNSEILDWYSTEGVKLKHKSKFRDLPAAIVWLLRRNDLKTIAEGERVLNNIQSLETMRSTEIEKLRAQIDAFDYEKHSWARQNEVMESEIKQLRQKLNLDKRYTSTLEDYCNNAGFPVAAIREAAVSSTGMSRTTDDSEDEDIAVVTKLSKTCQISNNKMCEASLRYPLDEEDDEDRPQCNSQLRKRNKTHVYQSPIITHSKTGTSRNSTVKVSVVKTVRDANNDVTTITRALSCDECSKHKEVVGMMPRRGPFQSYWDRIMLQASVYNLEPRDVWQIILLTIPQELQPKMSHDLRTGNILIRLPGETTSDIYNRIKENLLELRGPTKAEWHRIIDNKQTNMETFEAFAERMWVTFREYSGVPECDRDHEILLQMLRSNAGPQIQNALALGGDPPHNTYNALIEWATKIEQRSKVYKTQPIAAAHWKAEGNSDAIVCSYCKRHGHDRKHCFKLRDETQPISQSGISKFVGAFCPNSKYCPKSSKAKNTRRGSPYTEVQDSPYKEVLTAIDRMGKP